LAVLFSDKSIKLKILKTYIGLLAIIVSLFWGNLAYAQQNAIIEGVVRSNDGTPLQFVNVIVSGSNVGTASNADGIFRLNVTASRDLEIIFSSVGYATKTISLSIKGGEKQEFVIILSSISSELEEISVISSHRRFGNIERINHRDLSFLPDASGSFESILKSLPGVSSSHEMSSQYSVRGGNFDENLIYVNDIEIYRPFLIRSGQQEGLSFINTDMVEGVEFSAGGFNAEYGDKMSSVLNIKYKVPNQNSAKSEISLLGASAMIEGVNEKLSVSHLTGFRYKTSQYLLSTLDEAGDYNPVFLDFQSNIIWRLSPKFQFSFLGNYATNSYHFQPVERETRFGSFSNALQLKVYYQGQELNKFETMQGAVTAEYRPQSNTILKLITSSYTARESETFDIIGQYLLNELDNSLGSTNYGDSLINVGIGGFINHARNFLDANFYRIEHLGTHANANTTTKWGLKYQFESINDWISEWDLIDSSGYAVPYNGNNLTLSYSQKSFNSITSHRLSSYIQNSFKSYFNSLEITTTAGIRFNYWSFNNEINISPRASVMLKPDWKHDIAFHISGGYYHQPTLYKEYRLRSGELNTDIKSQVSIHAVFGIEYLFRAWDRPFRFQTEIYHKHLSNLVPYKIDNVRIQYTGENLAKGFSQGIDFKVNGEFVDGAESWASLSVMRTFEDIKNDSYTNDQGKIIYPGKYPRPTDQRFSIGAFFQDYIPGNPSYRVHLTGFFGTGLPFGMPNSDRFDILARMPAYKRVDIGFTKVFKDDRVKGGRSFANTSWLKSFWVSAEVFNLFDFKNTISYLWVQTVSNQSNESGKYAVPNYLTSRRINIKISAKF
jgi:hypothetical protein